MEGKKKSDLSIFFGIVKDALYCQVNKIDEQEELLEEVISRLEELEYDVDMVLSYETIYYGFFVFKNEVYDKYISEHFDDDEFAGFAAIISFEHDPENDAIYIYEIMKENPPKKKGRKPTKTLEDLQNELNQAVLKENYEEAIKLREKIEKKSKPKAKSVKKADSTNKKKTSDKKEE